MRGTGILINDNYDVIVAPLRDSTGKIVSGLQVGKTLVQNQGLILIGTPGEVKEAPQLGVCIEGMLLDNDYLEWRRKIRMNMEMDGQRVKTIQFGQQQKLFIDAHYPS